MTSSPTPEEVCSHCLAHRAHTPVAWHLPDAQRCPRCDCAYSGPPRTEAYEALVAAGVAAVDAAYGSGELDRRGNPAGQSKATTNTTPKVVKGIA